MNPKRIGFLGFDGVTSLHFVGPADTFASAALDGGYGSRIPCYQICTIGLTPEPFRAESGIIFEPEETLETAPELDTVVVLFKSVFGSPPAEFVENLRLNEAKRRLSVPKRTLDTIAASVGFTDADAFRRAFERRLGAKPRGYVSAFESTLRQS